MRYKYFFCLFLILGNVRCATASYDPDPYDLSASFELVYDEYQGQRDFINAYAVARYLDLVDLPVLKDSIADDVNFTGDNIIREDIGELVNYLNQFNIRYVDTINASYVNIIHKQEDSLVNILLFDQTLNNLFIMMDKGLKSDDLANDDHDLNKKGVNIAIIYKSTDFVYKSSFAVSYIDGKSTIKDQIHITNNVNNMDNIDTSYRGANFVVIVPVLADSRLFVGGSYIFAQNQGTRYIKEVGSYNTVITDDSQYSDDIKYFYNTDYYSIYARLNLSYDISKTLSLYNNMEFNVIGSLGNTSYEETDSNYALNVELKPYHSEEISYQLGFSNVIDALSPVHFNIATKVTYYLGSSTSVRELSFVEAEEKYTDAYWLMESTPLGRFEYSLFLSFFIGNFSIQYYISRRDKYINNSFMLYYGMKVGSNYSDI